MKADLSQISKLVRKEIEVHFVGLIETPKNFWRGGKNDERIG